MPWLCPDCKTKLSASAHHCPRCGCSFSAFDPTGILLWIFFLIALVCTGYIFFNSNPQSWLSF